MLLLFDKAAVYQEGPWWRELGFQGEILSTRLPAELSLPAPDTELPLPLGAEAQRSREALTISLYLDPCTLACRYIHIYIYTCMSTQNGYVNPYATRRSIQPVAFVIHYLRCSLADITFTHAHTLHASYALRATAKFLPRQDEWKSFWNLGMKKRQTL